MSHYKLKGTSGSVINQSFPLAESFVIGSAEDCQIQIEETGVVAHHAEISLMDERELRLRDLGSPAGTFLNGEPVKEALLNPGDEIHIGGCRWMLQAPGLRPDRVLNTDVGRKTISVWPRRLLWTAVGAATSALLVLKFKPEWLDLLRPLFE